MIDIKKGDKMRKNSVDFISFYEQEDKIPISKLKNKYITLFFDDIQEMGIEVKQNIHEYQSKLIIDPEKATLITNNDFCFIRVFEPNSNERQFISQFVKDEIDSHFIDGVEE